MKKLFVLITTLLLFNASPLFASVGIWEDGNPTGTVTDFEFQGSSFTNNGSRWTFNLLLAGAADGGATSMTTTDTAVSTSYVLVRKAIGPTVGQVGTLADGSPGQIQTIFITERSGSGTFVLTPTTTTGFETITFDAVGEYATLMFADSTTGWIMLSTTGTLAQP